MSLYSGIGPYSRISVKTPYCCFATNSGLRAGKLPFTSSTALTSFLTISDYF